MNDPIEEFINRYPPEVQAISRELRAMVRKAMPQAGEVLYARHNHFAYQWSDSMRSRFFYICLLKDYVRLGFDYGEHLPDPNGMLIGEGKRMRHVKVRTLKQAKEPALKRLTKAACVDAKEKTKK